MSKVTVVTDATGQIQALGHGHLSEATIRKKRPAGFWSAIRALPGQTLHELDLAEDVSQIGTWHELVAKVQPYIKTRT